MRTPRTVIAFLLAVLASSVASAQERPADPAYGGPQPFPRPHVHPRASAEELKARRARLAELMKDGVAVLVSDEPVSLYSGGRYRPGNNLHYYTGVESDFCALVVVAKDGKLASERLYVPEYDAGYELWNGKRVVADDAAKAATGVDEIVPLGASAFGDTYGAFETALNRLVDDGATLFLEATGPRGRPQTKALELTPKNRAALLRDYVVGRKEGAKVKSLSSLASKQRSIKSPHEIALLREAVRVTGEAHVRAIRKLRPGMWEFEFDGLMQGAFVEFGCTGLPYYPIAASGPNSCILHYNESRRRMEDGDVLLADIAAEWGWYAADVTRTYPVNGKFTPRQRQVYEAVLAGQTAAATILRPGVDWGALDAACRKAMKEAGLKDSELHPHGLGHPVGLDVHDVGDQVMKPGMLITIEPGSYLKKEGFGVRIEDVYLVTENGHECLSRHIPRAVDEIEALVGADFKTR
jgi:Xaa-Pro aminopeptidase